MVLIAGEQRRSVLFCRAKDPERETREDFVRGPMQHGEQFGFDEAYPIDELDRRIPLLLENQPRLYAMLGADAVWDARMIGWLNEVRSRIRTGIQVPAGICDLRSLVHEMRLIKDENELAIMRHAGQIARDAHIRAMQFTRPGLYEYEVEAELLHEFYRQGSRFPPTAVSWPVVHARVLHYVENRSRIPGRRFVADRCGCEWNGYASDITRTFPANGRFSAAQRDVYEIVLAASWQPLMLLCQATAGMAHDAALRVLVQGMLDLKLLQGSADSVIESESYKQFYMHRTGHWLGNGCS